MLVASIVAEASKVERVVVRVKALLRSNSLIRSSLRIVGIRVASSPFLVYKGNL